MRWRGRHLLAPIRGTTRSQPSGLILTLALAPALALAPTLTWRDAIAACKSIRPSREP